MFIIKSVAFIVGLVLTWLCMGWYDNGGIRQVVREVAKVVSAAPTSPAEPLTETPTTVESVEVLDHLANQTYEPVEVPIWTPFTARATATQFTDHLAKASGLSIEVRTVEEGQYQVVLIASQMEEVSDQLELLESMFGISANGWGSR